MDNIRMQMLRDAPRPSWFHSGARKNVGTAQKAQEILGSPEYTALAKDTPASEVEVKVQEAAPEPVQEKAQPEPVKVDEIRVEEAETESVVASEMKAEEDEVKAKGVNAEAASTPEKG
jgi:hypothetical protein